MKLMIAMAAMLCSATLLNAQDAASPEKVGDKVLVMKVTTYGVENSESIFMNNTNEELQQMIDVEYPGVHVVRLGTLGEVTEVSDYLGDVVAKVKFEGFEKALWVLSDHLWLQDEYVAKFGGLPGHEALEEETLDRLISSGSFPSPHLFSLCGSWREQTDRLMALLHRTGPLVTLCLKITPITF